MREIQLPERQEAINQYLAAIGQEKERAQKQLTDDPKQEQNRLRWIEFTKNIETSWTPVMDGYLKTLGHLWFGDEMRLKGPEFRKQLVPVPAYSVSHNIYGPMAIFQVGERSWREREMPFNETVSKTEQYQLGYRVRVVLSEDGVYSFQSDNSDSLLVIEDGSQIDEDSFTSMFAEVYSNGPKVIHQHWKGALPIPNSAE